MENTNPGAVTSMVQLGCKCRLLFADGSFSQESTRVSPTLLRYDSATLIRYDSATLIRNDSATLLRYDSATLRYGSAP